MQQETEVYQKEMEAGFWFSRYGGEIDCAQILVHPFRQSVESLQASVIFCKITPPPRAGHVLNAHNSEIVQ